MLVNVWQETLDYVRRSFLTGTKRRASQSRRRSSKGVVEVLECRVLPAVVSILGTAPAIGTTNVPSVTYTVTFDTAVTGVDASDFRLTTTGSVVAALPFVVTPVTAVDFAVTINGLHGNGDVRLDLIDDDSINDGVNPLGGPGVNNGSFQGQTYHLLQATPVVESINRSVPTGPNTSESSVRYQVTFSADVVGVDPSDFQLVFTGSANATTPVDVFGSGAVYTVMVNGITGNGTLGLNLVDDNSIHDLQGNPLASPGFGTSFLPQQPLSTGATPASLILADVNGDGIFDLIAANQAGNALQVALGNGNGTFQAAQSFSTGNGPSAVVARDINGDGRADLLTANKFGNTVSVLLGNGDGTFQPAQQFATGPNPTALALEDLNRDGRPDLVVVNELSDNVGVYQGQGNGTFAPPQFFATGNQPSGVALGDVNNDGLPDIIVSNQGSNDVSVLLANGGLSFQPQVPFDGGIGPASVAIGDFNADGAPDLVTANKGDDTVSVFLGDGNGVFNSPQSFAVGSTPTSVAVGDFNGDGDYDLVVANAGGNTASVLPGTGIGTFELQIPFVTGAGPSTVALGDIDRDGRLDFATSNTGGNNFSILRNASRGNFAGEIYNLVNTPPTITSPGAASVSENTPAATVVLDVDATDSDLPVQTLKFVIAGIDATFFDIDLLTGAITFKSSPDFEAPTDAGGDNTYNFTVVVDDGSGGTATQNIAITVLPQSDNPPIFTSAANAAVDENTPVSTVVLDVETTDADLPPQTVSYILTGIDAPSFTIDSSTGEIRFQSSPDFENPTDTDGDNDYQVTVIANDGGGPGVTQNISIKVLALNDNSPSSDSLSSANVPENTTTSTVILDPNATDNDLPAQTLTFSLAGTDAALFSIDGTTGEIRFQTSPDFEAPADAGGDNTYDFSIIISDNGSPVLSTTKLVTINVTNVTEPPVAMDGTLTVTEDVSQSGTLQANAGDGPTLTYSVAGAPIHGSVVIDDPTTGAYTYSPDPNYNGPDSFTFLVNDGLSGSNTAEISIMVSAVNDAPTFVPGPDQTPLEDSSVTAVPGEHIVAGWATGISVGPADEGDQSLSFQVTNNNNALFSVQPSIASNGTLSYTLAPDAFGAAVVTVLLKDDGGTADGGQDTSLSVSFTITVVGVNDAPSFTSGGDISAVEDSGLFSAAWATRISAGANESGQAVTFSVGNDNPGLFSVAPDIDSSGTLTFTPAPDASGSAIVTVSLSDDGGTANLGNDTSLSVTFMITITPVDDPPVATDGTLNTPEDTPRGGTLVATDIDSAVLTFSVTSGPSHGLLVLTDPLTGDYLYTPDANYNGPDSFKFVANDGTQDSNIGTVSINVTPADDPPVAADGSLMTNESASQTGTLTATDIDSVSLTFRVISGPSHGGVIIDDAATGAYTYTPDPSYNGPDTFKFVANDGTQDSNEGTIAITVTPLNSPPVGNDASLNVAENSIPGTVVGAVTATDPDVGDTLTFALVSGNTSGTFAVDSATGTITVVNNTLLDFENPTTFVLVVTVTDAAGESGTANVTINITNVDEPLVVTLPNAAPTYHRGSGPVVIDPGAVAADPDTEITTYSGGRLRVSVDANDPNAADDRLWVQTQGNGSGKISVLYGNVVYESSLVIIGQIISGANGGPLVIHLTSFATPTAVYTMMKAITFQNTSGNVQAGSRAITFDLSDASGVEQDTDTKLVHVVPTSISPVLTLPSGPLNYVNRTAPVSLDAAATVTDADSANFLGGRLTASIAQGASRKDRLSILGVGGVSVRGKDVLFQGQRIGRLTLGKTTLIVDFNTTAATPAAAQALLRNVAFATLPGNTSLLDRAINISLTDGDGGSHNVTQTVHVS